jgi:hypothetical protein
MALPVLTGVAVGVNRRLKDLWRTAALACALAQPWWMYLMHDIRLPSCTWQGAPLPDHAQIVARKNWFFHYQSGDKNISNLVILQEFPNFLQLFYNII